MFSSQAWGSIRFGLIEGKQLLTASIQKVSQSGWLDSNPFNVTFIIILEDYLPPNVKKQNLNEGASGNTRAMWRKCG